jgi:hypothetical protein
MSGKPSDNTPVTLVIVYPTKNNVELSVTRDIACQIVSHRKNARATVATFTDRDLKGNPYSVDVGRAAVAVYVK